jgi:DNA-binding MurR/RpiR family transcriptional regulator
MRRTLTDIGESTARAIDLVLDTHREAIEALQSESTRAKIRVAVSQLHVAERIVVFGIGPSAPLARYVTILLTRNGRAARPGISGTHPRPTFIWTLPGDSASATAVAGLR